MTTLPIPTSDEVRAHRLDTFLQRRGLTREMLVDAADVAYADALLLVASGSILHGFGNERSDIDVNVIVEQEATTIPILAFANRLLVDSMYFSASQASAWTGAIRDRRWPPAETVSHRDWRAHSDMLFHAVRFSQGLVLRGNGDWAEWARGFREPWMAEHVAWWWHVESIRRRTAARWLSRAKPLLAAQRALDAVLAALESRAARGGQAFFGPKWVSEKLRAIHDHEGLEIYRRMLNVPTTQVEAREYLERCERVLEGLGLRVEPGLQAQLWYEAGVTIHPVGKRSLVARWKLRGLEVRSRVPPVSDPARPIWEGPLEGFPPPEIHALFIEDMTWMSIVSRP